MVSFGDKAPGFALPNQDGTLIRLEDLRGKAVILFAFPKAGTPGCTMQACAFRDAFPQIDTERAVVLGISTDTVEALNQWHQQQQLQYDLLSDVDHAVLDSYSAWGSKLMGILPLPFATRSYWVIDEEGTIIDMQIGVEPRASVEKALKALDARSANLA